MLRETAMDWNMIRASLAQETNRRMINTDEYIDDPTRVDILNKFDEKLPTSGYNTKERTEILESGIR